MDSEFPVNSGNVAPPFSSSAFPFVPMSSQSTMSLAANNFPVLMANHPATNRRMRKQKEPSRQVPNLKLERVLGLTTVSSNILATAESHDLVAYAAGAVVVLYNHKRNRQIGFLYPSNATPSSTTTGSNAYPGGSVGGSVGGSAAMNGPFISPLGSGPTELQIMSAHSPRTDDDAKKTSANKRAKPISCLAFSPDGNFLAVGEMGHQPRILIWDVKERTLLHECRGHKFGVLSLAFSPNMRYLVSVGFQHDGYLYVWHWRKGIKLAGNKVTSKVNALAFSNDGKYFVTAGLRHVKFWYFDSKGRLPKRGNNASRETQVLDGRSGILGALKNGNFVAAACCRIKPETVYFLTDNGILCMFKEGRVIGKWVDLQVQGAYSLAVSTSLIICACANGVIRLFEPETLKYRGVLPKTHPLGVDISAITSPEMANHTDKDANFPDVIAVAYDEKAAKVTAIYSDRSLFLWDIRDLKKIGKYRSFISHSDCVWGVEPCPSVSGIAGDEALGENIPPNSFATYSADGTVRFWNLDSSSFHSLMTPLPLKSSPRNSSDASSLDLTTKPFPYPSNSGSNCSITATPWRNIYSRDLIKMLYVDAEAQEFYKTRRDADFMDSGYPDYGIRSLKMSADGKLLATGDRSGNLHVHDMKTWERINYQEAHDSEILSIDLTAPKNEDTPYLLATASRDRLLHIFDIRQKFQLMQSLDDHSSSITSVRFSNNTEKLISCSADKSIIFRNWTKGADQGFYTTSHNYSGRSTVFDMVLHKDDAYMAAVTGERKLFVFDLDSGKPVRTCKPETLEESLNNNPNQNSGGSLINIDLDPFSGTFAVTSGSDRSIRLFDLTSGTCIAKASAHAELITSVKFIGTSSNMLRVVSTCSDGTVFVWRISEAIVARMKSRGNDTESRAKQTVVTGYRVRNLDESPTVAEDKRLAFIRGNTMVRLRRGSTATATGPTPSISQMVRQGERRTFSTVSPAEQKYEDLYKRNLIRRSRVDSVVSANRQDASTAPGHTGNNPLPPTPSLANGMKHGSNDKTNRKTPGKRDSGGSDRKIPEGRLERLYNGIPTTGARERPMNPVHHSPENSRIGNNDNGRVISSGGQRRPTPPPLRMNSLLQRQMPREAFNKQDQHQKDSASRPRPRSNDGTVQLKQPSNDVAFLSKRRASASGPPEKPKASPNNPRQTIMSRRSFEKLADFKKAQRNEYPQDVGFEQPTGHSKRDDDDGQEAEDEREDEDEDDDDDTVEDEEIIFMAPQPEHENMDDSFKVSLHETNEDSGNFSSNENSFMSDETRSTAVSDDENYLITVSDTNESGELPEDEDDGSSEENMDESILRSIELREPPRLAPSLSRTTSFSSRCSHHPLNMDVLEEENQKMDGPNKKEPSLQEPNTTNTMSGSPLSERTTPTFREQFLKWERARKRESITTRFLSALGEKSGIHVRHSLDNVLSAFEEMSKNENTLKDKTTPAERITDADPTKHETNSTLNVGPNNDSNKGRVEQNELQDKTTPAERITDLDSNKHENNSTLNVGPSNDSNKVRAEQNEQQPDLKKGQDTVDNDDPELVKTETNMEQLDNVMQSTKASEEDQKIIETHSETEHNAAVSPVIAPVEDFSHFLSDLDGATILLDSVLDAYSAEVQKYPEQSINNSPFVLAVRDKLQHIADRINQTLAQSTIQQPATSKEEAPTPPSDLSVDVSAMDTTNSDSHTDMHAEKDVKSELAESSVTQNPELAQLLDKYSNLLMSVFEKRLARIDL